MENASDFVIDPNGMLRNYVGSGGDVSIPDEVTAIGANKGNYLITPFKDCVSLESVIIPESVRTISTDAFRGCINLKKVTLPDVLPEFSTGAFRDCNSVCFTLPGEITETQSPISGELARGHIQTTALGYAHLILFQKTPLWKAWKNADKLTDPAEVFEQMIMLVQGQKFEYKKISAPIADYILRYQTKLPTEQILAMLTLFKGKKCKEIDALEKDTALQAHLAGETLIVNPIEEEAQKILKRVGVDSDVEKVIKKGVLYLDSKEHCSREVLISILSYYAKEWKRCAKNVSGYGMPVNMLQDVSKVQIDPDVDRIAETLNKRELSVFLEKLISGSAYRPFLLSWARFADEQSVKDQTTAFKTLEKKKYHFSQNMLEALIISPTLESMRFFDRIGMLDRFADYYGTTAMELRDTKMIPDFGFDSDGKKRFDIGGNTIELRITDRLDFELYNCNSQKVVRSFPKKSNDLKKASTAAEDYKSFKKQVSDFMKLRADQLIRMHQTGEWIKPEIWQEVYLKHTVVKHLAERVVWIDRVGNTFLPVDGETKDAHLQILIPKDSVQVAHVLDMKSSDIDDWRHTLTKLGREQLFEQIWEPVLTWKQEDISNRYKGIVISSKTRNDLKANLKKCGIDLHSGEMDREFDGAKYYFSGVNTLYFGKSLQVKYVVDNGTGNLTLGETSLCENTNCREMNAILLALDRIATKRRICADDMNVMQWIDEFTFAQITEFIAAAQEANAVNVLAALLEYKNTNFSDFDPMDEFTLEW